MNIEVEHVSGDKLSRQCWRFWYYPERHTLYVNYYVHEARQSTRHRVWTPINIYDRLSHRQSTIKFDDVPLPLSVLHEAGDKFVSTLKISEEEYKR